MRPAAALAAAAALACPATGFLPGAPARRLPARPVRAVSHTTVGGGEVAANSVLAVTYSADAGSALEGAASLACTGGYSWDGSEEAAYTLPMRPSGLSGTEWRATVPVPNFAKSVDFAFTDGVLWDTNDGAMYSVPVRLIQEEVNGLVTCYRQEDDGSREKIGTLESVADRARALERELEARQAGIAVDDELDALVASHEADSPSSSMVGRAEQVRFTETRSEASLKGEEMGLSTMQVSEAREAYELFEGRAGGDAAAADGAGALRTGTDTGAGTLSVFVLPDLCDHMGFEVPEADLAAVTDDAVVTLAQFLQLVAHLEAEDAGLEII